MLFINTYLFLFLNNGIFFNSNDQLFYNDSTYAFNTTSSTAIFIFVITLYFSYFVKSHYRCYIWPETHLSSSTTRAPFEYTINNIYLLLLLHEYRSIGHLSIIYVSSRLPVNTAEGVSLRTPASLPAVETGWTAADALSNHWLISVAFVKIHQSHQRSAAGAGLPAALIRLRQLRPFHAVWLDASLSPKRYEFTIYISNVALEELSSFCGTRQVAWDTGRAKIPN